MVRLQHKHRRDGIILVNGVKYPLDAEGCVEVPEDAAAKMTQGGLWGEPGKWPQGAAAIAPPVAIGGARRPRTRAELEAFAEAEGIPMPVSASIAVPSPPPAPVAESKVDAAAEATETVGLNAGVMAGHPEPEPEEEPEGETIRISRETPREELARVAKQVGLKVPKHASQADLFELLKRAHGEKST